MYTNTRPASDVNADGYVSPHNALLLINALNTAGARPFAGVNLSSTYGDVSDDNYLSPLDALLVINGLNGLTGVGEGESSVHHTTAGPRHVRIPGRPGRAINTSPGGRAGPPLPGSVVA